MKIVLLSKCKYTNKDLISDRYGRLFELPYELGKLGHEVYVSCLDYYSAQSTINRVDEQFDKGSARWQRHKIGRFGNLLPNYIQSLYKKTKDLNPDLILGCSDAPNIILGSLLSKKLRKPFIADLYDDFTSFPITNIFPINLLFKKALKNSDGIICVSDPLNKKISKQFPEQQNNIITISNGIPNGMFYKKKKRECRIKFNLPNNAKIIGAAGDISHSRGINVLFDAFARLNQSGTNIHLALAGPLGTKVTIPQHPNIHYVGVIDYNDVPDFLNSLDLGVICNIESDFGKHCFPQKAFEMLACEIPILASRVGVLKELFAGYPENLFQPNSSDDLATQAQQLLINLSIPPILPLTWIELVVTLESFLERTSNKYIFDHGLFYPTQVR